MRQSIPDPLAGPTVEVFGVEGTHKAASRREPSRSIAETHWSFSGFRILTNNRHQILAREAENVRLANPQDLMRIS